MAVPDSGNMRDRSPEVLTGGVDNAGRVLRYGDLVQGPVPRHADSIHALLRHLSGQSFEAPRPVRRGNDGTEWLRFVPGDVPVRPYPAGSRTDAAPAGRQSGGVAEDLRRLLWPGTGGPGSLHFGRTLGQ